MRLQNSKRGLDEKKGTFTFKIFLSPVKASIAGHRAMYEWFFPRAIENRMALWKLGETSGGLATQIGDQIAWYLITQGINGSMGFDVSFPKGWGEIADFFHGQVNPLSSIISVQTLMEKGAAQALGTALLKTTSQLGQDALRDDFLIRKARMDPAVADRVAGLFWNLVEESVKATASAAKARIEDSDLFKHLRLAYYSREWIRTRQEIGSIQSITRALDSPAVFDKWKNGRLVTKMSRAAKLQATIFKLREELGLEVTKQAGELPKALPPPPDDLVVKADDEATKKADDEETGPQQARAPPDKLADAQAERRQLVEPLDPADIVDTVRNHSFTVKAGEDVFAGRLSKTQRPRRVRDAANLLGKYRGQMEDVIKALGDKSKWKAEDRQEVLETLDMARRVLNLESFNHLEASTSTREFRRLANKADTVFAARGGEDQGLTKPSEVLTPQRLKAIMDDIALVAPTGSGGYVDVKGGEYKKLTSDLDLTVVLKNKLNPPLTANERVALECMLQGTFRRVSNGLSVDDFDMSFMADERVKFSGESIEQRGPGELLDLLNKADPETLAKHVDDINSALEGLYADLPHGERYRSPDRIMGLVWLTSLGQDVYVKENGAFVRRKKSDLIKQGLENLPEDVRALVLNKRARLSKWMALGIAVDAAGFLGKKLPKKARDLKKPDLDKHPYGGYVKELDKRAIRILMGFLTTHPEGLSRLNALPDAALKGATVDHSTICKIGTRMLKLKLTAMAAWYDDLGGRINEAAPNSQDNAFKQTFRNSLRDAGCDDADFRQALDKARELRRKAQKQACLPATNILELRPAAFAASMPLRMAA